MCHFDCNSSLVSVVDLWDFNEHIWVSSSCYVNWTSLIVWMDLLQLLQNVYIFQNTFYCSNWLLFSRLYNVPTSSCARLAIVVSSFSSCFCHSSRLPSIPFPPISPLIPSARVRLGLPRFLLPGGRHFITSLFQLMHTIIEIIEMLKQFKIIIFAPTCFGSRRNHHQGAVLCLAKTTNMVFLCSSV